MTPQKISIFLISDRMESLGDDDVSIVHANKRPCLHGVGEPGLVG